ncbi:MAG: hypothetical protein AB7R69_00945 [Candidatus Babeliales bacterium]
MNIRYILLFLSVSLSAQPLWADMTAGYWSVGLFAFQNREQAVVKDFNNTPSFAVESFTPAVQTVSAQVEQSLEQKNCIDVALPELDKDLQEHPEFFFSKPIVITAVVITGIGLLCYGLYTYKDCILTTFKAWFAKKKNEKRPEAQRGEESSQSYSSANSQEKTESDREHSQENLDEKNSLQEELNIYADNLSLQRKLLKLTQEIQEQQFLNQLFKPKPEGQIKKQ